MRGEEMVQIEKSAIHNVRVESITRLDPPSEYWRRYPLPDAISDQVAGHRRQIEEILSGRDNRMLMIVGPCSIHDTAVGLDYADRLASLATEVEGPGPDRHEGLLREAADDRWLEGVRQ